MVVDSLIADFVVEIAVETGIVAAASASASSSFAVAEHLHFVVVEGEDSHYEEIQN